MAQDIKLIQDQASKIWDVDIENGDFLLTDGLDTALYLSVLGEARAPASQVSNPILRRGHFTNIFADVEDYEVGSLLWLYRNLPNTEANRSLMTDSIRNGLQWLIDDEIVSDFDVVVNKTSAGINVNVNLTNQEQEQSKYYDLFIKTFN